MKFFALTLALGVAQTAAFAVQPSTGASTTALNSDTGLYDAPSTMGS
eukprot:CAMPEP_0202445368 /NCGR_PEP_ID=MMETSP1360-20130828/4202_1 /ASSEMBLY_ACC=CAM_ASM_000848 /TAXON_ID=515479 /ORGANISM="Licmophora paradoxa, Strain CCMP2313" /LENGTH=46 /DNA_ID= /DNA_START= /DNA_END= /DNA_ORIENTATION=